MFYRQPEAIRDLADLPLRRYPHEPLLERIWENRGHLTAHDAAYVALAEALDAPLLTRDRKLASSSGHGAAIELLQARHRIRGRPVSAQTVRG